MDSRNPDSLIHPIRSMQWEPVHILERNKCVGKLQLGVSGSGQFVYAAETGANGSFSIPEFNQEKSIRTHFK
jgi:hypothetical protein